MYTSQGGSTQDIQWRWRWRCSGVFIINFEHVSYLVIVFLQAFLVKMQLILLT